MKKQKLKTTIGELHRIIEDLAEDFEWKNGVKHLDEEREFQLNIIKKDLSDTWEIDTEKLK